MSKRVETITVWLCDECGYWRKDKSTGIHQTNSSDDPNGKQVRHVLREAEFIRWLTKTQIAEDNTAQASWRRPDGYGA